MATNHKSFDDEKAEFPDKQSVDYVETGGRRRSSVAEEATELSAIEATAASKAAWLISATVSIGGFLFGKHNEQRSTYSVVMANRLRHGVHFQRSCNDRQVSRS